jgi:hypothetical protein
MNGASTYPKLTLQLSSNGEIVKLARYRGGRLTKPVQINANVLRRRSQRVRDALSTLSAYVRMNPEFDIVTDPGWDKYSGIILELQEAGSGLYDALFDGSPDALELAAAIDQLEDRSELIVQISDEDVTLPLGFVYQGNVPAPPRRPCKEHFANFWVSRFRITVLIENSGCDDPGDLQLHPSAFSTIYALSRDEFDRAAETLTVEYQQKLKLLLSLPLKEHYDWASAEKAWEKAHVGSNVLFVMAHSDGDYLSLAGSRLDSGSLTKRFRRPETGPATLLLLNCCLSASGGRGGSLLSVVARPGFSGLVGTEAEILNTHALRCGTYLMWELCANASSLGEALDNLHQITDKEFFPLNLLYTCYADRAFSLSSPIDALTGNLNDDPCFRNIAAVSITASA